MTGIFALIGFALFALRRLTTYLHLFQQEEYDNRRFLAWLVRDRAWDQKVSGALLVVGAMQFLAPHYTVPDWAFGALAGVVCLAIATFEADPRKSAKKKLVMTARARRIYGVALGLLAVVALVTAAATGLLGWRLWLWIVPVQLVPLALVGGNQLLSPAETRTQQRYWDEAQAVLRRVDPMVIAITGSFGKTSVKHILGHVLETAAPTLITPGSVNTAMGIARVIRERLQPHHRYFVVEMGAYGPGSIRRLCALTPPKMGLVTAIGMAHYERFKSLETVAEAKFELAEAAAANGGKVIAPAEVLDFATPRRFAETHADALLTVGAEPDAALVVDALRQDIDGIAVAVTWQGRRYELRAPLFGLQQGKNLALAFAAACTLGLAPEDVVASLRSLPQIAHRLEVKREASGATLIDDAYNSNPVGFAAALEVLDVLRRPGGRRILVTPGMVELGAAHDDEHRRIGRLAASHVDVLVAVAPHRVAPLAQSFAEAAPQAEIVSCAGFAEAQAWMSRNITTSDVVLLENDLPDLLEQKLRL
ncbi:MAG TPA: UDP-N-acetylmuramoyl-tripeptide--D-alanyl-D-alanine ligase [Stellaceae bacterium]|nr:UDP-N-acetylmuramoyl-tripeptide--D-alanyl-D-alanine ligase [Stellaceae bacterium]